MFFFEKLLFIKCNFIISSVIILTSYFLLLTSYFLLLTSYFLLLTSIVPSL